MKRCDVQSSSYGLAFLVVLMLASCGSGTDSQDAAGQDSLTKNDIQNFDVSGDVTVPDDILRDEATTDIAIGDLFDEDVACLPDCTGIECGTDPLCGYICGKCSSPYKCVSGECVFRPIWTPGEYTAECGDNGMCLVASGTFDMGCHLNVDSYCEWNFEQEGPVHSVTLSAYYIDRKEVTVADYQECVEAGACTAPLKDAEMLDQSIQNNCNWDVAGRENHPVNCVDWTQASTYCQWLGKRLPTEAEWEMAARGKDGRNFPWGITDPTCDLTNYNVTTPDGENRGCGTGTTAVACKNSPAGDSPYGLCDMAGNVYEWTNDYYGDGYSTEDPQVNPQGPETGNQRVIRGGAYSSVDATLRTTFRYDTGPANKWGFLGFRCARTVAP